MALILDQLIEENDGCLSWNFTDASGDYSATNTGGYGSPNVATTAITIATLTILPYGFTVGYTFTFTMNSGDIQTATVTAPDGTITNILADMSTVLFPFIVDVNPFVIIGEWLGFGVDSEMTSEAYNFEYNVTDGTNTYTSSSDELIVCQTCCCSRNLQADLDSNADCDNCENKALELAMRTQMFLDSAIWAMENGDVEKAHTNLIYAKELCGGGCSSCN